MTTPRETFNLAHGFPMPEDGQYHPVTINLDSLSDSDLLIAMDHPGLHADQRRYADLAYQARKLRLMGHVEVAYRMEHKMDHIHDVDMPRELRW